LSRARIDSLVYFLLGAAAFLALGWLMPNDPSLSLSDFKAIYYASQAQLRHQDPYLPANLLALYRGDPVNTTAAQLGARDVVINCINLPTTLLLFAPFAMIPSPAAHALWSLLVAAAFLFAAYLMWNVAAEWSPRVAGFLMLIVLSGSQLLLQTGNAAGLVVSLCAIAAWCLVRQKHVAAGVVCLGLALALKPQDAGFIWLFFLLTPAYRRSALQALAVVAAIAIPAVPWTWHVSPNWMAELNNNVQSTFAPGQLNDAANAMIDPVVRGPMIVSLQTITSLYWSHAAVYNTIAYLALAPLLLIWISAVLRRRFAGPGAWIALGAAVPITMLFGYHRQYDTRLLLVAAPVCALLSRAGNRIGRVAVVLTFAAALASSTVALGVIGNFTFALRTDHSGMARTLVYSVIARPVPWTMLALAMFYAWLLRRREPLATEP
jgi:hypothetical protein